MGIALIAVAAFVLLGVGLLESLLHRRHLASLPVRVHVSGTRGKSSVTRLIAAGLRAGGVATAAKTTGTLARFILPDGRELPVFRPAGANVIEQVRIVTAARAVGADALVVECMAVQPWLHWISEHKLVRATHAVITNARPDHLEEMGPTAADVARCLAGMIPPGGVLVTAEREHLPVLQMACEDRGTRLICITEDDLAAVDDDALARFGYIEHRENVAVALRLVEELGVPREVALAGMLEAAPDPGALTEHTLDFFGRRIVFVNAFAANDPQSTESIWHSALARHPAAEHVIALFNLRADRPSRSVQLASATYWRGADRVVLMGSGAYVFARAARDSGYDASRFSLMENGTPAQVFETVIDHCQHASVVVAMANMGGGGLEIARYFRNRALLEGAPL